MIQAAPTRPTLVPPRPPTADEVAREVWRLHLHQAAPGGIGHEDQMAVRAYAQGSPDWAPEWRRRIGPLVWAGEAEGRLDARDWAQVPYVRARLVARLGAQTVRAALAYEALQARWDPSDPAVTGLPDAEWRLWGEARDRAHAAVAATFGLTPRAFEAARTRCLWTARHDYLPTRPAYRSSASLEATRLTQAQTTTVEGVLDPEPGPDTDPMPAPAGSP